MKNRKGGKGIKRCKYCSNYQVDKTCIHYGGIIRKPLDKCLRQGFKPKEPQSQEVEKQILDFLKNKGYNILEVKFKTRNEMVILFGDNPPE